MNKNKDDNLKQSKINQKENNSSIKNTKKEIKNKSGAFNKKVYRKRNKNLQKDFIIICSHKTIKTVPGNKKKSMVVGVAYSVGKSTLGIGIAKAKNFYEAKIKALQYAKKNMIYNIPMINGSFPFNMTSSFKNLKIIVKKRYKLGLKTGSVARDIFKLVGYTRLTSKFIKGIDKNRTNSIKLVEKVIKEMKSLYNNKILYQQELLKNNINIFYAFQKKVNKSNKIDQT